jgi:4-diphosphocytidyl-2-C-methyl-D-erythritol kinase
MLSMTTAPLTLTTKAKLNLSLNITGKRADGYHLLHSIVAFCEVGDVLHIAPSDTLSLAVEGQFADGLSDGVNNLVMRAARLLRKKTGVRAGAQMVLEKYLPVAGGIGGGSGDAAAALKGLNQMWQCGLSDDELSALGATLGADLPVCLYGKACVMEGVGERVTPLALPEMYAVLVNPLIPLSTPEVFQGVRREEWTEPLHDNSEIASFTNDLQASAIRLCPEVSDILYALANTHGVLVTQMTGSGATCFGLYKTQAQAVENAAKMQIMFPDYWVAQGRLY